MALIATKNDNFKRPDALEPGGYPGRVVQVIDLGLQPQSYEGEEKAPARELYVTHELSDEFLKDADGNDLTDKPRWFSHRFALKSGDKAKATAFYKAIDPANKFGGDWAALIGSPVMVTLVQNPSRKDKDVIYNNIGGLSPIRAKDADKLPALVNEPKVFDLDEPNLEVFKALPEFLQEIIKSNLEYNGSKLQAALGDKPAVVPEAPDNNYGSGAVELDDKVPY